MKKKGIVTGNFILAFKELKYMIFFGKYNYYCRINYPPYKPCELNLHSETPETK